MRNKLIVFEGIDGVGKTILSTLLNDALVAQNISAVRFEDIEDKTKGFNKIKSFIKEDVPIDASLFFYVASSIYKSSLIASVLEKSWVICDRYIYSTLAFHKARGADLSLLPALEKIPIIMPDAFFLLTVQEKVRIDRLILRSHSIPEDFIPNTPRTTAYEMEGMLKSFQPIIIDNSWSTPQVVIANILHLLKERMILD